MSFLTELFLVLALDCYVFCQSLCCYRQAVCREGKHRSAQLTIMSYSSCLSLAVASCLCSMCCSVSLPSLDCGRMYQYLQTVARDVCKILNSQHRVSSVAAGIGRGGSSEIESRLRRARVCAVTKAERHGGGTTWIRTGE